MKRAFTLAEVLITLSVIGVIAAIVLPSLNANFQEKAWDTQRKALHARLSQALAQMGKLDGYGLSFDEGKEKYENAAEIFVQEGLGKVYKVTGVCAQDRLSSCGLPSKVVTFDETTTVNFPTSLKELRDDILTSGNIEYNATQGDITDTKACAFESTNGESVAVFYNPKCGLPPNIETHSNAQKMCVNFVYDLNGEKGPNVMGKDIGFITAYYRKDPVVVAPTPLEGVNSNALTSYSTSKNSAAEFCANQNYSSRIPDKEEVMSIMLNQKLLGKIQGNIWSGSIISSGANGLAWEGENSSMGGIMQAKERNFSAGVLCVKK